MFSKKSKKRKIVAGLGLVGFAGAVVLIQNSSDMSKWSNFGANVGLSIGVSVFVWFLTEDLRARLLNIETLQRTANDELVNLRNVIETSKELSEAQRNLLNRVTAVLDAHGLLLNKIGDETLGNLDGVLTALGVILEDQNDPPMVRPSSPHRWKLAGTTPLSVKGLLQKEREDSIELLRGARANVEKINTASQEFLEKSQKLSKELEKRVVNKRLDELQDQLKRLGELVEKIGNHDPAAEPSVSNDSE